MAGVQVVLDGTNRGTLSASNGSYSLPDVPAGTYTIVVTSAGPGESGGYSVSVSAPDQTATAEPGESVPGVGTPPAGPAQPGGAGAVGGQVGGPSVAPAPGTVTGTVVDTQGRPIAGARVWVQPAITTGLVEVRTDNQGRYVASSLIDVPYNAKAWAYVEYGGRQLCLRMGMESPVDYDAFVPAAGAVRNFRWQLTGPIEDLRSLNEYFGGMLRVMNTNAYGARGRLEFAFTPTGPRIDGSTVAPFTRTIDPARDTPEMMGEYVSMIHPELVGLSGSPEDIDEAAKAYRVYYRKDGDDPEYYLMAHTTFTYLMAPEIGFLDFYGSEVPAEAMAESAACYVLKL